MIRDSLGHLQVSDPTIIVEQFGGAHPEESVVVNLECDLDLLTGAVLGGFDISDLKQSDVSVRVGHGVDILSS